MDGDARELVEEGVQGLDSRGQREEAGVFKHLGEAVEQRPCGAGLEGLVAGLAPVGEHPASIASTCDLGVQAAALALRGFTPGRHVVGAMLEGRERARRECLVVSFHISIQAPPS